MVACEPSSILTDRNVCYRPFRAIFANFLLKICLTYIFVILYCTIKTPQNNPSHKCYKWSLIQFLKNAVFISGVRPTDFTGSFFMSNTTDVELASINCDASLCIEIKYDDKLTDEGVNIQCAILYTSCSGQRRLRVHNLALNSCIQMAELFRSCELDTMMNVFLKDGLYTSNIFMSTQKFKRKKKIILAWN